MHLISFHILLTKYSLYVNTHITHLHIYCVFKTTVIFLSLGADVNTEKKVKGKKMKRVFKSSDNIVHDGISNIETSDIFLKTYRLYNVLGILEIPCSEIPAILKLSCKIMQ